MTLGMLVKDKKSDLIGRIVVVDGDLVEVKLLSGSFIIAHKDSFKPFKPSTIKE